MRRTTATLLLLAILVVFGAAVGTAVVRKGDETNTAGPGTTSTSTTSVASATTSTLTTVPRASTTTVAPAPPPTSTTVAPSATSTTSSTVAASTTPTTIVEHPNTGGRQALGPGLALIGLGAVGLGVARPKRGSADLRG